MVWATLQKLRRRNSAAARSEGSVDKKKNSRSSGQAPEEEDFDLRATIEEQHASHQVVLWIKSPCPYCEAAKDVLLQKIKGLDVAVRDLTKAPQGHLVQDELERMTGQRTVPNIFVHGKHIGGNSQLQELYHSDTLEKLLFPDIADDDEKFRAVWKGVVLAECANAVRVRLSYYFPPESVQQQYFRETDEKTFCGSKGEATHYTVTVRGKKYVNAAWSYKDPYEEAAHVKDHFSFYEGVMIMRGRQAL